MFDRTVIFRMKKGASLVITARGNIVDTAALVEALKVGHLPGYAGDVWYPQPASKDHRWRRMSNHGMVPHYPGTTLEAQVRYSNGIRDCLENRPLERQYLIVNDGKVVSTSYSYAFTT